MRKIFTVSLNPALDSSAEVSAVQPDIKLRCANPLLAAGGGGVNVSRAIKLLGGDSTAFVALGGATGNMLAELLVEEGVKLLRFHGPGMTRQNFAISETDTGKQFRFGQPGPVWSGFDEATALGALKECLEQNVLVVASGSLPPGMSADFYVKLGELVADVGGDMIVDTSGAAKKALLETGMGMANVLRMDHHESELLAGQKLETLSEAATFAQSLVHGGHAKLAIMARGANGSVFATKNERFHWVAPKEPVVSKVGAGDSFVGGLTLGLSQGHTPVEAGKLATAAAAAAVTTPGSQLCPKADVDRLLAGTVYTAL